MSPDPTDPIPDGDHAAVVDRVTEGLAVLLVGDDETEAHVPVADLPDDVGEGSWLTVTVAGGAVTSIALDAERTAATAERIEGKLDRIRRNQGGSRFGS